MYKKKLLTIILSTCILGLLGFLIGWGFNQLNNQEKGATIDLYTLVPQDSKAILEIHDINALEKELSNAYFNQEYKSLHVSELLTFLTDRLTRLTHQKSHGLSYEMGQLLLSFHEPDTPDAQIVYGKLGENDQRIIDQLTNRNEETAFTPKHVTYQGEEITIFPIGRDFLSCYIKDGFFAISYQKKLIEKVIDSYLIKNAINHNEDFEQLRHGQKSSTPLLLYLRTSNPTKKWERFDIRMNAEAIYMTGISAYPSDNPSMVTPSNINRTEGLPLPLRIQLFYQCAFECTDTIEKEMEEYPNLAKLLSAYVGNSVNVVMYSPLLPVEKKHQLLVLPIQPGNEQELRQALRLYAVRCPNHWTTEAIYPIWKLTSDESLHRYFVNRDKIDEYYVSILESHVLVSSGREGICDYINELKSSDDINTRANKAMYQYCLNDLAEEANFTMVADMSDMMASDSLPIKEEKILLPFFFKHKDFFKNFMFSTQFINTNGLQSTNLIFTYQGDSILKKKMLGR